MVKKSVLLLVLVSFCFQVFGVQGALGSSTDVVVFSNGEGDICVSPEEGISKCMSTKGRDGVHVVVLVLKSRTKALGFAYMNNFSQESEEQVENLVSAYKKFIVLCGSEDEVESRQLFVVTSGDLVELDKELVLQIKENIGEYVARLGLSVGVEFPVVVPYLKVKNSFLLRPYDITVTLDPREGKEFFSLHTKGRGVKY